MSIGFDFLGGNIYVVFGLIGFLVAGNIREM